jgi:Ca2+/Na+ antiporter
MSENVSESRYVCRRTTTYRGATTTHGGEINANRHLFSLIIVCVYIYVYVFIHLNIYLFVVILFYFIFVCFVLFLLLLTMAGRRLSSLDTLPPHRQTTANSIILHHHSICP